MKLLFFILMNLVFIGSVFSTATILQVIPNNSSSSVDTNETTRVDALMLENISMWDKILNVENCLGFDTWVSTSQLDEYKPNFDQSCFQ